MVQMADSRRRFVMPKGAAMRPHDLADVEVLPDGRVIISPVKVVPLHELWATTGESAAQITAAMEDYMADRTLDLPTLDSKIAAGSQVQKGK